MRRYLALLTLVLATPHISLGPDSRFALVWGPSVVSAQSVRGRVLGPNGGVMPCAIVVLTDSASTDRTRVLSSAIGSYLLRAPGAGRYTIQVLRIGYPAFRTAPFALEAT